MFRALMYTHHQEVKIVLYSIWYVPSQSVGGLPVHKLREDLNLCTGRLNLCTGRDLNLCTERLNLCTGRDLSLCTGRLNLCTGRDLNLCTERPPTECDCTYQMLYNTILSSWWWAQQCSKHVEDYNKLIIKEEFVHLSWFITKVILSCTVSKT